MATNKEESEKVIVGVQLKKIFQEKLQEQANRQYPQIEKNLSAHIRDILIKHLLIEFPDILKKEEDEDVSR